MRKRRPNDVKFGPRPNVRNAPLDSLIYIYTYRYIHTYIYVYLMRKYVYTYIYIYIPHAQAATQ